jgi:hypothetical protein
LNPAGSIHIQNFSGRIMAASKYAKSSTEIIPAMIVCIGSHFFAELSVKRARDEERDDNSDIDQIIHGSTMRLRRMCG